MLWQLTLNGFAQASGYLIVALSFALIYRVVRFFHFSHGVIFTFGPYFCLALVKHMGFGIYYAIPLAVLSCSILGCFLEITIYQPPRKHGASGLVLLLISLGAYIVLQNLISLLFGDGTQSIRRIEVSRGLEFLGATISPIQIQTMCASLIVALGLILLLAKTSVGMMMRAVANDPVLARCSGIESDHIILWTFAIGSALAGLGGILVALDIDMSPTMGMNALLMGLVAVIIGGAGNICGIMLGALVLGLAQSLSVWKIGSQWQTAVAFSIMLSFLLFR